MSGARRVLVSGIGSITTFGVGIEPLWSALLEGRSGIGPISRFDASGFACPFAAEISGEVFDPRKWVPKSYRKAAKVMSRDIELAVGAAASAIESAGLVTRGTDPDASPTLAPDRVGCHIGAGLIAADVDELTSALAASRESDGSFSLRTWGASGMQNLTPLWMLKYLPNMLACHVTIIHDCQGPSNTITCAEASGGLSIGESMRVIERGDADCCLSGGAESKVNPMGLFRQQLADRIANAATTDDPQAIVRPFAEDAAGTVVGEGGGILVLEAEESLAARGGRPAAELAGFSAAQATCLDGSGLRLDMSGEEVASAIDAALSAAGVDVSAVDAVVPYGAGIPTVDAVEGAGLRRIFGDRLPTLPLVTLVPNVGSCAAGAGGLSIAVAAKCLAEQHLPARLNPSQRIVGGLDAAATPARPADLRVVLSLNVGMGGQIAAIVLRRVS